MEDMIAKIVLYVPLAMQLLGTIAVIATVIVQITPSKSDNPKVKKIADIIFKLLGWLPTVGLNPNTVKLKAAYDELHKK